MAIRAPLTKKIAHLQPKDLVDLTLKLVESNLKIEVGVYKTIYTWEAPNGYQYVHSIEKPGNTRIAANVLLGKFLLEILNYEFCRQLLDDRGTCLLTKSISDVILVYLPKSIQLSYAALIIQELRK